MTMWLTREMGGEGYTKRDIEHAIEHGGHDDRDGTPLDLGRIFIELGKKDPRPFIERLKAAGGTTILLVEQLAWRALEVADRGYVLEQGRIRLEGTGAALLKDDGVRRAYLGASHGH